MTEQEVRQKYREITLELIRQNKTITTMESCTAGQLASLLTDTEGSSQILKGAFVTYCNEAKIRQGVPAEIIAEYGVYSEQTAKAMAAACRQTYRADIGIGVTGTMGNVDPVNNDSIPGTVWFAIETEASTAACYRELEPMESRLAYKLAVAAEIADALLTILK